MIKSGTLIVAENKINSGEIIFDMNSITALTTGKGDGQDNLSKHLKSQIFDAVKYPEAKFVVKGCITPNGASNVKWRSDD